MNRQINGHFAILQPGKAAIGGESDRDMHVPKQQKE